MPGSSSKLRKLYPSPRARYFEGPETFFFSGIFVAPLDPEGLMSRTDRYTTSQCVFKKRSYVPL